MTEEIPFSSATALARQIADGELSPVTVVQAYLDRIESRDEIINAYITVDKEGALEQARAAKRAVDTGEELGPLHGVPIAIKDLTAVTGLPLTFGSKLLADNVAEEDDVVVERLRAAGAIILGKTNTSEFGFRGATDNLLVGPTGTPFDPTKNAGGSSGGSAAAVADGMAALAQGTDGGGSVRIPASCCGVIGLKPTFGRIPHVIRPDAFAHHTPFGHHGVFGRTTADVALMLDVLAGPHPRDPFVLPETDTDYRNALDREPESFDIAYSSNFDVHPVDPEVEAIVDDAMADLSHTGANVTDVQVGHGYDREELTEAFLAGSGAKAAERAVLLNQEYDIDLLAENRADVMDDIAERFQQGEETSALEVRLADTVRTAVFDAVQDLFEEYDLLVTPTLLLPPFDNDVIRQTGGPPEVDGVSIHPSIGWRLTQLLNMTGHPAASVPAGFTDSGLPVGVQIVGPLFDEPTVLQASALLERIRPWQNAYLSNLP